MSDRLCVYMPSFNVKEFLFATVRRIPFRSLPSDLQVSVLFVDNASTDGTPAEIERARADLQAQGIPSEVIRHEPNRGYGGSVKSAMDYALRHGIEFLAIVHPDGQYAPEELPRLVGELRSRPDVAMHFGSRLTGDPLKGGMPVYKFMANHVLSRLQNVVTGLHLSEYHSGYKLYRMSLMQKVPYRLLSDGFVFDNEVVFQIRAFGLGISESPIPTFYGKEKSTVPKLGTPLRILRSTFGYAMHRLGLRRQERYTPDADGPPPA